MTKSIYISSKIDRTGLTIFVDGRALPIEYPRPVWKKYPNELKRVLQDNLTLSSTFFIPQILNIPHITYETSRPIDETFLFKNGIYDMSNSALIDRRLSTEYIKKYLNTQARFKNNEMQVPKTYCTGDRHKQKKVVIPFTFGKDSLLTAAIAREIGLQPHLVYFVEPAHRFEYAHKKSLMSGFYKKTGMVVDVVKYGPGRMRYGNLWNKNTELGWGLQTTEYSLLALPLLHYYDAHFVALGNEHSCSEIGVDKEGMLVYWTAYDQHPDWTPQQSLLASLVGGRKVKVLSLVEGLDEIAEIAILHRLYPEIGRFQTSCLAINASAKNSRWCQNCEKCGSMYAFMKALGLDTKRIGFTENLFDKKYAHLYKNLFSPKSDLDFYGVEDEVLLAIYLAFLRGFEGQVIQIFKRKFLDKFKRQAHKHLKNFFEVHPTKNVPTDLKKKILPIYKQELLKVRNELKILISR